MTAIAASLVKELREQTGAGMMDCKRALEEAGGDIEAAVRLLRERGAAQAAKRAGRETPEGIVLARIEGGVGSMVAIGCETEPVSKNEEFRAFAQRVLDAAFSTHLAENPPANKLGVLVQLRGGSEAFARNVAMHIAWADPRWNGREDVPDEVVTSEREIYANSDEVQSKPEQAREKIVEGMLNKRFFATWVLIEQPWVHATDKTVGQALEEEGAEVLEFERFQLAG